MINFCWSYHTIESTYLNREMPVESTKCDMLQQFFSYFDINSNTKHVTLTDQLVYDSLLRLNRVYLEDVQ